MDLGRAPAARWPEREELLSEQPISAADLEYAVQQVGDFDKDNRAGIDATLHRISAMRSRAGRVVGLTCRVGRAIPGSAALVEDLALGGKSILLLGRPGEGEAQRGGGGTPIQAQPHCCIMLQCTVWCGAVVPLREAQG